MSVGIATFSDFIETSPNRIACDFSGAGPRYRPRAPRLRRHTPRTPPPLPASLHERNTAPARQPTAWLTPVVKEIPPLLAQNEQNTALFGVPGRRIFHRTPHPSRRGGFSFIPVTRLPHRRVTTGPARLHQHPSGTKLAQHAPPHNRLFSPAGRVLSRSHPESTPAGQVSSRPRAPKPGPPVPPAPRPGPMPRGGLHTGGLSVSSQGAA